MYQAKLMHEVPQVKVRQQVCAIIIHKLASFHLVWGKLILILGLEK